MILYHYTSFEHFVSIWKSKTLRFSLGGNTNDFFERFKTFVLCQETFICDGKQLDRTRFDHFDDKIRAELHKYRQVSFSCDYDDGLRGYASPMMWGQYAWGKDKNGNLQNGVCIAIDSERIKTQTVKVHSNKVSYKSTIATPIIENIDYTKEGAADIFIERNIDTYFFSKHSHWEHENEFRYVCKNEGVLDISEAIIGIYVLWDDYTPLDEILSIVNNDSIVSMISLDEICSHKEPLTIKEIKDLLKPCGIYKW